MINKFLKPLIVILTLLDVLLIGLLINDKFTALNNDIKEIKQEVSQAENNIDELFSVRNAPVIDINKLLRSSVTVLGKEGMGSGTIIKKTESYMLIISCYHVVADIIESNEIVKNYFIAYTNIKHFDKGLSYSFGSRIYEAKLLKYDKDEDMILLKVEVNDNNLTSANIAYEYPKIGDVIYSIGNPLGLERTLSKGILSNIEDGFYVSDNTTTFGNSGGGLFNVNGDLIGIPSRVSCYNALFTMIPESGLGQSITLNRIKKFLEHTELDENIFYWETNSDVKVIEKGGIYWQVD